MFAWGPIMMGPEELQREKGLWQTVLYINVQSGFFSFLI